jgi:hypothetical protein
MSVMKAASAASFAMVTAKLAPPVVVSSIVI